MKKLSLVLILTAGLFFAGNAQFDKGDNALDIGVGPSWRVHADYYGWDVQSSIGPAFMFNFEHGTIDIPDVGVIGFGGMLGFKYFRYKYDRYTNSDMIIIPAFRAAFHFQFFDSGNFDLYAGLSTGPRIYVDRYNDVVGVDPATGKVTYSTQTSTSVGFHHDLFAGARYMFSDSFGLFAELGYGVSYFKGGVSFKF